MERIGSVKLPLLKNQLRHTTEEGILMKGGGTYPNLFCAHPPFQIDGNFGFAAAILEMILQGDENQIELLPALPTAFSNGSVKGIRAKGGFCLDFSWENSLVKQVKITAIQEGTLLLFFNGIHSHLTFSSDQLTQEFQVY